MSDDLDREREEDAGTRASVPPPEGTRTAIPFSELRDQMSPQSRAAAEQKARTIISGETFHYKDPKSANQAGAMLSALYRWAKSQHPKTSFAYVGADPNSGAFITAGDIVAMGTTALPEIIEAGIGLTRAARDADFIRVVAESASVHHCELTHDNIADVLEIYEQLRPGLIVRIICPEKVQALRQIAQGICNSTGKSMQLCRFAGPRELVETIEPDPRYATRMAEALAAGQIEYDLAKREGATDVDAAFRGKAIFEQMLGSDQK